jgi:hypothetical protein
MTGWLLACGMVCLLLAYTTPERKPRIALALGAVGWAILAVIASRIGAY